MLRILYWPRSLNLLLIALGAMTLGFKLADVPLEPPSAGTRTIFERGETVWSTKTVKRVVKGRVVHRDSKVYVLVPTIVVRTDHHTIRVPAHRVPLRSASATVALHVPVTVYIPVATTVFVPTTVTSVVTSTETTIIPTTITLPLIPTTSDQ